MSLTKSFATLTLLSLTQLGFADVHKDFNPDVNTTTHKNGGSGISVQADLILWNTDEDGLIYAINDEGKAASVLNNTYIRTATVDGKVHEINPKWDLGFKVGAGKHFKNNGWDLFAQWTHFNVDAKGKHLSTPGNNQATIKTAITQPAAYSLKFPKTGGNVDYFSFLYAFDATAKLNLKLNLFDIELGKMFKPQNSELFTLRPHFGIRYVKVDQSMKAGFKGDVDIATPNRTTKSSVLNYNVTQTQDFWGIGLRGGFDGEYSFSNGLALYGKFAASILYGDYGKIQHKQTVYEITPGTTFGSQDLILNASRKSGKLVTDLDFGIQWNKMFNENKYGLTVQAGWEHHLFVNHNQMLRFHEVTFGSNVSTNQGDLAFHGLKFNAKLGF